MWRFALLLMLSSFFVVAANNTAGDENFCTGQVSGIHSNVTVRSNTHYNLTGCTSVISFVFDMSTLLWNETNITIQNVTFNIYGGSVLPTLQIVMAQRNNMAAKTVQVSNISIDVVGVVVTAPNFLQLPLLRLLLNETVPTTFKREAASLTIFENISVNVSGSTLNFVGPQAALLDITCAKCAHIYVNISNCSITVQTASPHFVVFKSTQKLQDITLAMTGVNASMNVTPCNSTWAVDGQPCRVAGITSFAADYIARTSSFFYLICMDCTDTSQRIIVVVEQGSLTMVFLGSAALNVSTSASIVIIQSARLYFNATESSFDFQEIGIHVSHIVARLNAGCNGALVWLGGNGYDANPGRMQAIVVYVTNVSATISLFECSSFFRTAATIQLLVSYLRSATLTVIDICLQTRMLCMQRMPPLNSSTSTLFPSSTPALLSYFVAITAILADNASNMSLAVTSAFLNSTIANFVITMYQSEVLSSNLVEESAVIVSFRSVEAVASQLFIVIADTVVDATTSLDSPVVTKSKFVASSITGILHALLICSLTDVRIVTVSISNSEIQSHFSLVVVNDAHLRVLASFSINVNPAVMVYDFLGADPAFEYLFSSLFAAISTGVNIMRDSSQAIRNCSLATSRNSIDTSEAASIIRVYASLLMPPTNSTNCSYIVSNSTAPVSPESSMRIKLSIFGVLCYPSCFFNISSITLQRLFGVLSPSILYVLTEDQSSSDRLMLDASSVHFLGLTVDGDSSGGSVWNRTAFLVGNPSIQLDGSSLLKFNRLFGQSPFSIATTHPKKPPTIDLGCNRISSDSLTSLSPSFRTLTSRMLLKEFGSQSRVVNVAYPDPPFTSRFFLPDDNFTCRLDPLSESIGETHTLSMDLPFTDIIDPYRRIDVATTTLTSINVVVSFVMFIGAPDSIATVADAQLFMMLSQSSCAPASLKESTSTAKSLMISPFAPLGKIAIVFGGSSLIVGMLVTIMVLSSNLRAGQLAQLNVHSQRRLFERAAVDTTSSLKPRSSKHEGNDKQVLTRLHRLASAVNICITVVLFLLPGVVTTSSTFFHSSHDNSGNLPVSAIAAALGILVLCLCVGCFWWGYRRHFARQFAFRCFAVRQLEHAATAAFVCCRAKHARQLLSIGAVPVGAWHPPLMKTAFGKFRSLVKGGKELFSMYPTVLVLTSGFFSGLPAGNLEGSWGCYGVLLLVAAVAAAGVCLIVIFRPNRCRWSGIFHATSLVITALTSILCVFQLDVSASNENDNSGEETSFVSASNNLLPIAAVMNSLVSVFSNVHAVAIMWLERRIRMTNLTAISLTIAPPAFSTGTSSTPLSLRQSDDVQRTKASTFQDSHSDLRSRMSVARTLPTHVSGVTTVDGIGGDPPSFLSLQTMIRYICDQNNC